MKALANLLFNQLKKHRIIQTERVRGSLLRLYRENNEQMEKRVSWYYIQVLQKMLWVLLLAIGISILIWGLDQMEEKSLQFFRNDYGGDEQFLTLQYQNREQEQKELTITLAPIQYRPEELEQCFQDGFAYLEEEMLGENKALGQIQESMNLLKSIPDSGLTVTWYSDNYELIDEQGNVNNVWLEKDETVYLILELSYEDTVQTREYEIVIQPKQMTEAEQEERSLQLAIEDILQVTRYDKEVLLPTELQGMRISEKQTGPAMAWVIILLGIVISGMLWFRQKEELQNQIKKQNEDFQKSYPYLVNQLVLYIGAGTTLQGAFERIIYQYETGKKKKDFLYKELSIMWNEMRSGISQEQAYINLGKRIGLPSYLKLTTLFVQQIRKGTSGIILQLEQEEHDAFEHRKEQAKRLGEEAGTKLLLPMILLMLISMVIVVCPAMMNFI